MENVGDMGQLTPGATYIYEKANGVTYAREFGKIERTVIGIDVDAQASVDDIREKYLWDQILKAAKKNPALQDALERVIVVYELSKQPPSIQHHPV